MRTEIQFSVFMVNKPGILSLLLSAFAKARINIVALTMVDTAEHGVLRVIGQGKEKIRTTLKQLNLSYSETEVLAVTISNKSGALADITGKLSRSHVNISYAYCTAGAAGGKTTGILKVADVDKAIKVLKKKPAAKKRKTNIRRLPALK